MAPLMILPKTSLVILVLCLLLSFDQNKQTKYNNNDTFINTIPLHSFSNGHVSLSVIKNNNTFSSSQSSLLEYDFYRNSCPRVERIVRSTIHRLHRNAPSLVPALIRLFFHDCFIQVFFFFFFFFYIQLCIFFCINS